MSEAEDRIPPRWLHPRDFVCAVCKRSVPGCLDANHGSATRSAPPGWSYEMHTASWVCGPMCFAALDARLCGKPMPLP